MYSQNKFLCAGFPSPSHTLVVGPWGQQCLRGHDSKKTTVDLGKIA